MFTNFFKAIQVFFLLQKSEDNSDNENQRDVQTLLLLIMLIVFYCKIMPSFSIWESLKELLGFHGLSYILKYQQDIFFVFQHTKHLEQLYIIFLKFFPITFFWQKIYFFPGIFIFKRFNFSYSFRIFSYFLSFSIFTAY